MVHAEFLLGASSLWQIALATLGVGRQCLAIMMSYVILPPPLLPAAHDATHPSIISRQDVAAILAL